MRALISVYDKTGLAEFARVVEEMERLVEEGALTVGAASTT